MVPRTSGYEYLSFDPAVPSGSVTAAGQGLAAEPAQPTPPCLGFEHRQLITFNLPSKVVSVVLVAYCLN